MHKVTVFTLFSLLYISQPLYSHEEKNNISQRECVEFFTSDFTGRVNGCLRWCKETFSPYSEKGQSVLEAYLQNTFSSWSSFDRDQKHLFFAIMGLLTGGLFYQAGLFRVPEKILKKAFLLTFCLSTMATAVFVHSKDPDFFKHFLHNGMQIVQDCISKKNEDSKA